MKNLFRGVAIASYLLTSLLTSQAEAQDEILATGKRVYLNTCATGYCHTPDGGAGGGGARLTARGFDLDYITRTVSFGLHETRMLGFATTLPAEELQAVIAYVASLNGIAANGIVVATKPPVTLSPAAERGKTLLHDPLRGFNRCATCHEIAGSGVPVADPIVTVPASTRDLKRLKTAKVATVRIGKERMPGLVLNQGAVRSLFYDLTSTPPVRRNVETATVEIKPGSRWRHSDFTRVYNDTELEEILEYLRAQIP
jgi:cytochrome c5